MMKPESDALFIPIDLEASLGRIEDVEKEQNEMMIDCIPLNYIISESRPKFFATMDTSTEEYNLVSPDSRLEKDDMDIDDREQLIETIGCVWDFFRDQSDVIAPTTEWNDDGDYELEVIPDDDNDFSKLSKDDFVDITDPISFWEHDVQPTVTNDSNVIPNWISF